MNKPFATMVPARKGTEQYEAQKRVKVSRARRAWRTNADDSIDVALNYLREALEYAERDGDENLKFELQGLRTQVSYTPQLDIAPVPDFHSYLRATEWQFSKILRMMHGDGYVPVTYCMECVDHIEDRHKKIQAGVQVFAEWCGNVYPSPDWKTQFVHVRCELPARLRMHKRRVNTGLDFWIGDKS